jgi:drug/metabolite transporter (DMT)-like permease
MITMVIWGFNFVAVKIVLVQLTPNTVALVRCVVMYLMLVAICSAKGVSVRYPRKNAWRILMQGFLSMGIYMIFFLEGMKESGAAEGAIILGTSPAFTLLFAVLVRQEKFKWSALLGIVIAFCGVALVVVSGQGAASASSGSAKLLGNVLVFCSSAVWALSTVVSRPLVREHEPLQLLTLSMPGALLVLIPYSLSSTLAAPWATLTPMTWAMLVYFIAAAGVIGFTLFYVGVSQVGASGAMVYQYLVSPLAAISAWLFLAAPLHPLQIVGLGIVLAGVAVSSRSRSLPKVEPLPEVAGS